MVSQNVIPHRKYFGGSLPYAFTEQGVAMLSSVLNSARAIQDGEKTVEEAALRYDALRKDIGGSDADWDKLSTAEDLISIFGVTPAPR